LFVKERSEMIVVALHLTEIDERIVVALPARGLELIRDQISVLVEPEVVDLDPNWSRSLEHSVYKTEIDLVAVAEGPPLLLGDIARMRPGSLIEFDAACLEHVNIESDGETLFQGKLGQSKGYLSICVEAPVSPRDEDE
jgi:flagellar motor switch protein FliM